MRLEGLRGLHLPGARPTLILFPSTLSGDTGNTYCLKTKKSADPPVNPPAGCATLRHLASLKKAPAHVLSYERWRLEKRGVGEKRRLLQEPDYCWEKPLQERSALQLEIAGQLKVG